MTADADADRWHTNRVDVPLSDLVDGFDLIADRAIPYGRLPGRARTVFGDSFHTWADLADQTVATLTDRPKAGITTVDAVLRVARETVAAARSVRADEPGGLVRTAVRGLLARLDDYELQLLSARGWALRPKAVPATAALLGVSRNHVNRNQPHARRRLAELLAHPEHTGILIAADDLRRRLGPLTRERTAAEALAEAGLDLSTDAGQLLLHVAGPYAVATDWLETTSGAGGLTDALGVIDAATRSDAPTTAHLVDRLATIGVPAHTAEDLIATRSGLRAVGDRWVRWAPTLIGKVTAAMQLAGHPATVRELTAAVDGEDVEQSVRDVLHHNPRFIRVSRTRWALREWGGVEYSGLFTEIAARIDAEPGPIPTDRIVVEIAAALPDVAEASVRSYLSAPGFLIDNGAVRRRTAADGWPAVAPLNTVRGVFRNGRDEIRVAIPVARDVLRGAGHVVSPALGTALGIHPGGRRAFSGQAIDITLSWRESALNGARFGSLRGLATDLGARHGDTLVLIFDTRGGTVDAEPLAADADEPRRLRGLLGEVSDTPIVDLARALDCAPEQVLDVLTRRGDISVSSTLR